MAAAQAYEKGAKAKKDEGPEVEEDVKKKPSVHKKDEVKKNLVLIPKAEKVTFIKDNDKEKESCQSDSSTTDSTRTDETSWQIFKDKDNESNKGKDSSEGQL